MEMSLAQSFMDFCALTSKNLHASSVIHYLTCKANFNMAEVLREMFNAAEVHNIPDLYTQNQINAIW
ncbi:unnamed protein product [Darwinula stevensoni]|uniref:Uncharacterized protein n=1 Tax=Darwinula stevensoni TaxID=69355 RepID=A0A7R8WY02_9CRUS|nr:unnamed protein product [Darwinula stevensoni]CAG0878535.1 unnamed protein product [Darwinula stevensoni]